MFKGKALLQSMEYHEGFKLSAQVDRVIAFKVIIGHLATTFGLALLFVILKAVKALINSECFQFSLTFDLPAMFLFFYIINIKMTMITLIGYQSFYLAKLIEAVRANFTSLVKFAETYRQIMHIYKSIKSFDKLIICIYSSR